MKLTSLFSCFSLFLIVHFAESSAKNLYHEAKPSFGVNEDLKKSIYNNEPDCQSIISKGTKFYLFTKATGESYTEIVCGNVSSLVNSAFGFDKTSKVIIHGWPDSAFGDFVTLTRKAYLSSSLDVNVIAVDYSSLVLFAKYAFKPVAEYVAKVLDWMVTDTGVSLDLLHVMGHSVGAQVAGMVGEHVTVGKVARITGMDPAQGFGSSTSGRLDSSDAQFVDVIHTCGLFYSYFEQCGDVDFYPNRGHYNQPGCIYDFGLCSHLRAYSLFAESISSTGFVSRACDSWKNYVNGRCENNGTAVMGEQVDTSASGKYYLHTASSSPYALGDDTATLH